MRRYPALLCLLQILNKFLGGQRPAGMRALASDGQSRFRLPCAEVLLPSCGRQWLRHGSGVKYSSCSLAPQWQAALDQGHSSAPKTKPALTGLNSV